MLKYLVRPFNGSEYDALAKVLQKTIPGFLGTAETLRKSDEKPFLEGPRAKFLAEFQGQVVGVGMYSPELSPQRLTLSVYVLEEFRRQGIGSALYEVAIESALGHRPDIVATGISEMATEAVRFAEKRGFREFTRVFESRADLTRTTEEALSKLVPQKFHETGIQIQSLAHTTLDDAHRKFYELHYRSMKDVPNFPEAPKIALEDFLKKHLDEERSPADGVILAVLGSELVGFTQMMLPRGVNNLAAITMTGCSPRYRGGGVATTLKIEAMKWAKRRGLEVITTWNDSTNVPILRINEKLGFERRPGTIIMDRAINKPAP